MTEKWEIVAAGYRRVTTVLETWGTPLIDLAIRVALFRVYFVAGLLKVGHWEATLLQFHQDYQVPFLPYQMAAVLATVTELLASTLVLVGLGARVAALPMLEMAFIISFWLTATNPVYHQLEHYYWLVIPLLLMVIVRGPGRLSFDYLIRRRFEK